MSDMLIPKGKKHGRIKAKRASHPAHLILVRQMPCVICLTTHSIVCHHLMRNTVRGMGLKAPDTDVLPLCYWHHTASDDCAHDNKCGSEGAWFASKDILDPLGVARALYAITGNYEAMLGVITGAKDTSDFNSDTEAGPKTENS
ncbi:MAG: DUF968 domain-containing protein [Rhodospirillaceae bacterium]|nr:DUF968 domain-containing protein [Rhodospirillaceae bacterium]